MAQESWNREEEAAACQAPEGPVLCTNNCGFFGSVTTMNLCSKCHRELILKQQSKAAVTLEVKKSVVTTATAAVNAAVVALPKAEARADEAPPKVEIASSSSGSSSEDRKPAPNRCFSCRKRVGLTGFKCRCGDTFCSMHRYSDKHDCSFDYKAAGREAIAKANPVVKADKLEKI